MILYMGKFETTFEHHNRIFKAHNLNIKQYMSDQKETRI